MKLSAQEFRNWKEKRITLIGMSGAGKTYISGMLEKWGWLHYSCDYEIGTKYMTQALESAEDIRTDDISALSDYLGKLGNPELGGRDLPTFKERQKAYYDAECESLRAFRDVSEQGTRSIVNDSTGSLCEIEDAALIDEIGRNTLVIYLQTSKEMEEDVKRRAQEYPKPLFFPPKFLDERITEYLAKEELSSTDEIEPDAFARWVFPHLFEARKPKYQKIADRYGVTISSQMFLNMKTEEDFLQIIEDSLGFDMAPYEALDK